MKEERGPDPICRWRNPSFQTAKELIEILPKAIMNSDLAREITNENYGQYFFDTPYQLACQLGLYYESNENYYPRFTYIPSDKEISSYLENWITKYYVPNPYTRSFKRFDLFKTLEPFSIHSKVCEKLYKSKTPLPWPDAYFEIFPGHVKNTDIIKNALNHSEIILINNGQIMLKESLNYSDLLEYIIDIPTNNSEDKEFFFLYFNYPIKNDINQIFSGIEEFSKQEIETVREAIIKMRIRQSNFRKNLLNSNKNQCLFTGINHEKLLVAGHIKPWSISNNDERVDPNNGILLSPTFDKLFDKYYISFDPNGYVLWSKRLDQKTIDLVCKGIDNLSSIKIEITDYNKEYYKHHRIEFLKLEESSHGNY
ncbi:HNH endonuclease [Flavobacterium sp. UBA4854]|uniref:HNH endonuclease n=1 Tax=Flavobacterium sp. UBA4854 TaxID=1946548 RepID=UPI00257A15B8|nr:HNH endonuclease [Flavobacterium sp. UBA4854]